MAHQGLGWTSTILQMSPGSEFQSDTTGAQTLDGTGDAIMLGFSTYEACKLTGGTFYVDILTGTSPFWKLQLWPLYDNPPVGTYGYPDMTGTVLAESAAFQATGSDYRHEQDFTSQYTATKNQKLALVLRHSSGTVNTSNKISVEYSSGKSDEMAFPWIGFSSNVDGSPSGTWNDKTVTTPNITCVTNKDYDLGGPASVGSGGQYTGSSSDNIMQTNGDKMANKWVIPTSDKPFEMVVGGFRHYGMGPTMDKTCKVGLWNQAGTFLGGTASWDADMQGQAGDSSDAFINYYFDTDVTVESGGTYYIGIERTTSQLTIGRQVISSIRDTGSGISASQEAKALRVFRSWPLGADYRMFIWDASDGTPAWKIHSEPTQSDVYPYSRMLIDPIIHDIHGKYSEGEGCPPAVRGKGDRGHRAPSRVANPRKSGYKVNLGKKIQRNNAGYGWNPYA